jgi:quercetin dioxygenase-like cupin family protein
MSSVGQTIPLAQRVVRKSDYIPCAEAFVDTRLYNRDGKLNYCIIGPGVAENSKQHVHISEPHGFNVGGVSLPTGKYNSLHSHLTAEVFLVMRGSWRFFWGHDGTDGETVLSPGDVISVPTGCFRAFESVGSDDNFMISWLGEDDPGCVTWENAVVEGAAEFGFYLTHDSRLIDTKGGDALPPAEQLMQPLSEAQLLKFNRVSPLEMAARVYNVNDYPGHTGLFADEQRSGGHKRFHAIIGETFAEQSTKSHILNPHSFSLAAICAEQHNGMLLHQIDQKQVLTVLDGTWEVTIEHAGESLTVSLTSEDTVSVPANAVRSYKNISERQGTIFVATSGDLAANITWV